MNFSKRCRNFLRQPRFKIQKQFIGECKNVQIAFHFPFGRGDGGITAFAHAKLFHIVGDLSVQIPRTVGAHKADARTEAQINHARRFVKRGMFGQQVAIIIHQFRTVQFAKTRAEAVVEFM